MTSTFYVCYGPSDLTCGAAHKDLRKAQGCCRAQGRKNGTVRQPYPVQAPRLVDAKLLAAKTWGYTEAERGRKLAFLEAEGKSPRSLPDACEGLGDPTTHPLDGGQGAAQGAAQADPKEPCDRCGRKVPRSTLSCDDHGAALCETCDSAEAQAEAFAQGEAQAEARPTVPPFAQGEADADTLALAQALASLKGKGASVDAAQVRALIKEALAEAKDPTVQVLTVQALPPQGEGPPQDLGLAHGKLPVLIKELRRGNNVLMVGEAGSGKTYGAEQAAKALGRETFVVPQILDAFADVSGYVDAHGTYQETALYRWAKAEPGAVLILDEIDGSDPNALLRANGLLAGGSITFPNGETLKVPEAHTVIGCANTWGNGPTAAFMGRAAMDGAAKNRLVSRITWAIDPALEMKISTEGLEGAERDAARDTVNVAQRIRENLTTRGIKVAWGPRDTFALVRRILDGDTLKEGLEISALAELDPAQLESALTGIKVEG